MASKKDFWQQIFPFISILIIKQLINIKDVYAETNINEIANLRCEQICTDDKQQVIMNEMKKRKCFICWTKSRLLLFYN